MNTEILEGKWHEVKGKIKEKWGALTDDELDQVDGKFEQLEGILRQKYGLNKEQVESELKKIEVLQ